MKRIFRLSLFTVLSAQISRPAQVLCRCGDFIFCGQHLGGKSKSLMALYESVSQNTNFSNYCKICNKTLPINIFCDILNTKSLICVVAVLQ